MPFVPDTFYNRLQNDGTYTYTYDAEGNRASRTSGSQTEYFSYDYRNRLEAVRKYNGSTPAEFIVYHYDAFDRRVARAVDLTPTTPSADPWSDADFDRFVYDGDDVILDFLDDDGYGGANAPTQTKRYLHGAAVDQVLAQEDVSTNAVLWHLADNLDTVRDLVDNSGTLTHFTYDSFGKLTSGGTPATRYLYTGRELDTTTGLQYNRARWYDPRVGRFVSEDPIGFTAGDSNLSRYVGNSPTNYTDPSGLAPPDLSGLAGLAGNSGNYGAGGFRDIADPCGHAKWISGGKWIIKNVRLTSVKSWGEYFAEEIPNSGLWEIPNNNIPTRWVDAGWWFEFGLHATASLQGTICCADGRTVNVDITVDFYKHYTVKVANRFSMGRIVASALVFPFWLKGLSWAEFASRILPNTEEIVADIENTVAQVNKYTGLSPMFICMTGLSDIVVRGDVHASREVVANRPPRFMFDKDKTEYPDVTIGDIPVP